MSEPELLGHRVGHIRVVDFLGQGGMGAVYVGFDERLQRRVALKALHQGKLDTAGRVRLLREARTLSQLRHPHVCQIFDYLDPADVAAAEPGTNRRRFAAPPS